MGAGRTRRGSASREDFSITDTHQGGMKRKQMEEDRTQQGVRNNSIKDWGSFTPTDRHERANAMHGQKGKGKSWNGRGKKERWGSGASIALSRGGGSDVLAECPRRYGERRGQRDRGRKQGVRKKKGQEVP